MSGGFQPSFWAYTTSTRTKALYAKLCLVAPVIAIDASWDLIARHPDENVLFLRETGEDYRARHTFRTWFATILSEQEAKDPSEGWPFEESRGCGNHAAGLIRPNGASPLIRWAKKWRCDWSNWSSCGGCNVGCGLE